MTTKYSSDIIKCGLGERGYLQLRTPGVFEGAKKKVEGKQ